MTLRGWLALIGVIAVLVLTWGGLLISAGVM